VAAATEQMNIRIAVTRAELLRAEAKRQRRTITSVVDEAIETYLALVTPVSLRDLKRAQGKGEK
jgi:hypothetical protein